jgi:hypothetical protein
VILCIASPVSRMRTLPAALASNVPAVCDAATEASVWTLTAVGKDLLAEIPQGVTSFFSMQLSTVVVNTQRLELITSSLLDRSAMMGDKKLQLKAQPIALWPVVQSTVRLFSNMAMPGVKIEAKVPSSLPAVHADEHRVAQVLGNLLSNAFKATRHGSVVVMAVTKGAFLEVSVKDTGPGMSKTTMRNLFNPLSSGQEEQRESGGMGLGLNLSHDLVQAHGVRPKHRGILAHTVLQQSHFLFHVRAYDDGCAPLIRARCGCAGSTQRALYVGRGLHPLLHAADGGSRRRANKCCGRCGRSKCGGPSHKSRPAARGAYPC